MKTKYNCTYCKQVVYRYSCQTSTTGKIFCDNNCRGKWLVNHLKGPDNPNFKNGNWIAESYCKCGKLKDCRAIICIHCRRPTITKIKLEAMVQKAKSYLDLSIKLHISRQTITKLIKRYKINTTHFINARNRLIPNNVIFVKNSNVTRYIVRNRILTQKLLPYRCMICGQGPKWNSQKLTLHVDHKNGNSTDNRLINLRILCPNCHEQQSTNKGKNSKGVKKYKKK
jgi:hypothetical protein